MTVTSRRVDVHPSDAAVKSESVGAGLPLVPVCRARDAPHSRMTTWSPHTSTEVTVVPGSLRCGLLWRGLLRCGLFRWARPLRETMRPFVHHAVERLAAWSSLWCAVSAAGSAGDDDWPHSHRRHAQSRRTTASGETTASSWHPDATTARRAATLRSRRCGRRRPGNRRRAARRAGSPRPSR